VFTNLSTRLSFDATKSSTFQPAGVTFNASFGLTPNNIFLGQYFQDKVHIGGATLPNMTLAVANVTQTLFDEGFWGIVGLGARLSEAIFNSPVSPFLRQPQRHLPHPLRPTPELRLHRPPRLQHLAQQRLRHKRPHHLQWRRHDKNTTASSSSCPSS
jgi:Eukaryotic aspartyl protease